MAELAFLPKLLLQHDASPDSVLEDVHGAFLAAAQRRAVLACTSPCGDGLAVALGQRLVVLRGLGAGATHASVAAVEFVSAVDAPEALTSLCWLAGGSQSSADECLLLGTSEGFLQLHSASSGALLLRQRLHHSPAVSAAVRWSGAGSDPDDLSEDVTLTFADAVVRLPAWEVWAAARWAAGRGGGNGSSGGHWWSSGGGASSAAASSTSSRQLVHFSKFTLPKGAGPRSAALCLGPPPPSLYAALSGRPATPHRVRILTAGSGPPLAAYEAEETPTPGLLTLVSDLASSTASSLLGRAAAYVPGRSLLGGLRRGGGSSDSMSAASRSSSAADLAASGQPGQQQQQQGRRKAEKIPGEPATLTAAVWDEKRSVTQMALSPCGGWAACCDTLGRVVLVDATSTLVVRMLKGYRDAQVAWLVCSDAAGSSDSGGGGGAGGASGGGWGARLGSTSSLGSLGGSSALDSLRSSAADLLALPQETQGKREEGQVDSAPAPAGAAPAAGSPEQQRQGAGAAEGQRPPLGRCGSALLVTHAPRRGLVELWDPHTLTRLGSLHCGMEPGLLLQQPARRRGGGPGGSASAAAAAPAPNRVLLLDASSLHLSDLTASLNSLAV